MVLPDCTHRFLSFCNGYKEAAQTRDVAILTAFVFILLYRLRRVNIGNAGFSSNHYRPLPRETKEEARLVGTVYVISDVYHR
jgi:hypothetical protein